MESSSTEDDFECSSEASYEDYWIGDFLRKKENQGLVRIHDAFLEDKFNILGLEQYMSDLHATHESITDKAPRRDYSEESALYLLMHQRFVFTKVGLDAVLDKVVNREYGTCPRIGCRSIPAIPIGMSNEPCKSSTKIYCHGCVNIYEPKSSLCLLDGCAWGRSFPHFLILTYPYEFVPKDCEPYTPRLFGFRICAHDDNDSMEED
jgi:casein kinase II subunit beta